jgi:hypothetical protein
MRTLAWLIGCIALTSNAGEVLTNEMMCENTKTVFNALKKEHGEMPVVFGKSDDIAESVMTLWTNPTSDSWTIVATKDDISCIVGSGQKLKVISYNKKNNT